MCDEVIDINLEDFLCEDEDSLPNFQDPPTSTVSTNLHPNSNHLNTLKSQFGHATFKPIQWSVISTILDSYTQPSRLIDQCIVMATGFGKSLCYQFIPVHRESLALIISPLISLMQDQVRLMEMRGIPAVFLGSGQENSTLALSRLHRNEYRLLYISPEYCIAAGSEFIINLHSKVPICLVAIDEAHCVSSWGHDFRPEYGNLSQLRDWLPEVPFLALTATASQLVREDIVKKLSLKNPVFRTSSLNRPNLYFEIHQKSKEIETDMKMLLHNESQSSTLRRKYAFNGSCIVYCISRNATEEVCGVLKNLGVECEFYHAGLSPKRRGEIHSKFARDEIECIIATIAFGMGIDKPDIRLIIHYGAPKEMESFMQEVGRAGRDDLPSRCVVFHSAKDSMILQRIVLPGLDWNSTLKEYRAKMMQKMEMFLRSNQCRRQQLLEHFDEAYTPDDSDPSIRCCDYCTSRALAQKAGLDKLNLNRKTDFTEEAKLMLDSVQCRDGIFGVGKHALLLTASSQTPDFLRSHRLYGSGRKRNQKWWMAFGKLLQYEGYLDIKPVRHGYASTVALTDKSKEFLSSTRSGKQDFVKLIPTNELNKASGHPSVSILPNPNPSKIPSYKSVQKNTNSIYQGSLLLPQISSESSFELVRIGGPSSQEELTPEQEEIRENLYLSLISIRNDIAHKFDCASFMICTNKVATNLATLRPSCLENLKQIDGISDLFCNRYGSDFLKEIHEFCAKHPELKADAFPSNTSSITDRSPLKKRTIANPSLEGLDLTVYERYSKDSLSVEEICRHYSIPEHIVYYSLIRALDAGYIVDYRKLGLDQGTEKLVLDVVRAPPINSDLSMASSIKELLKHLPEWMIDMSLTLIRITYGIHTNPQQKIPKLTQSLSTPVANPKTDSLQHLLHSFIPGNVKRSDVTHCANKESVPTRPKKRKLPTWL